MTTFTPIPRHLDPMARILRYGTARRLRERRRERSPDTGGAMIVESPRRHRRRPPDSADRAMRKYLERLATILDPAPDEKVWEPHPEIMIGDEASPWSAVAAGGYR